MSYHMSPEAQQITFEDFNQASGLKLDMDNPWVKAAEIIPWRTLEKTYADTFTCKRGNLGKPFRLVFGSLIIQKKKQLSDRKLIREITENPYLQYFIGYSEFSSAPPFAPSALVLFRKRLNPEILRKINDAMLEELPAAKEETKKKSVVDTLIEDATCAPSYIRYPQDFSLLNEAREKLEKMIQWFHEAYGLDLPRTYKRNAHKEYLALAKKKKRTAKEIRAFIRKHLGYVKRDIGYLDEFMHRGYAPRTKDIDNFLTIRDLYDQQYYMWKNKTHRVENRIVSITQPWIRPIVRGKTKAPVEFGGKLDISIDEKGHARIEKLQFDSFNEGGCLIDALNRYKERTGKYPARVLVDQIYRTRENRQFCKENNIRISGPRLGRPSTEKPKNKTEYQDNTDRIEVERHFSLDKRESGMGLITAKLEDTSLSSIVLSIITTNIFASSSHSLFWLYIIPADIPSEGLPAFASFQ